MKTLIIGGGASGLYLGSLLSDATVLERNTAPGRKLSITGGGRCNYTHSGTVEEILPHYHGSRKFIKKVLYNHTPEDITARLEALGVRTKEEEGGKRYPASDDAGEIVRALSSRSRIINGKALSVERHEGLFIVRTDNGTLEAGRLVLAGGGASFPSTGSDGSLYSIARSLGHTIVPPRPALSQLTLSESLKGAEGVSLRAGLKAGKRECEGDVMITRTGLSGPAALDISRELPGELAVSFLRGVSLDAPSKLVKNAVPLPSRLTEALLGELAVKRCGNLSKKERSYIISRLTCFTAKAEPVWKSAMVTAGGVDTKEINAPSMESKIVKNLYFIGEIIDVDADSGGYNLTWAFSSAYNAAKALQP